MLGRVGEKRKLLNNILRIKDNWIGRILRRKYLLHDATEGQMTEMKEVGRRRRTQLLEHLRSRRRYWELKEEAEVRNGWKRQFINRK